MSSVKFINEIIWIYFSPRTFQLKVNQCYPTFHWSWNVWEMFSLISFLKNFSRMKPWWREELQLPAPVTIKRSFLGSCKWNKLFERYRQLRLLPKHFICQSYFMFQIIFLKWKKMQKYCSKPHPPPGMTLPRRAWVRHNSLRTGVGRFRSCLYKWGMASSAACKYGAEEQTVDHAVLQCPIHRPPHGLHGVTVLDDETTEWLLNTCPEI